MSQALYGPYKPKQYYFEVVTMALKVFLSCFGLLFEPGSMAQV